MGKSSLAQAESRLKQLCCLGLGREEAVPAILAELGKLIPNQCSLAFFIDKNSALAGDYRDNQDAAQTRSLYMREFHGRRGRELGGAFPDNVRTQIGVQDHTDALGAINVDLDTFLRSDFYNLIYRPHNTLWFMRLMVREGGKGRALGCITLYRETHDRPWSTEDKRRLAGLESFLAQVLRTESSGEGQLADSGKHGLIIADRMGRLLHLSREGQELLHLATHPNVTPRANLHHLAMLPPPVARICRDLSRIYSDKPAAQAPVYHHRNAWGGFRFEAQWLNAGDPGSALIGISISHQEPLQLRLARRIAELPLSQRQAQVCLHMAIGRSNEEIAANLGIARHTAIAHGRWIYNKLGVHNRAGLVAALLTPA